MGGSSGLHLVSIQIEQWYIGSIPPQAHGPQNLDSLVRGVALPSQIPQSFRKLKTTDNGLAEAGRSAREEAVEIIADTLSPS